MEPKDPEGRKARQIAHAMSTYCRMLGGLAGFYFLVFTVTNFAPMAMQFMAAPAPSSQLLLPAARTTQLPPDGCTPMLAQYITMYAPGQVCALLSTPGTPATDCTPMLAHYIAMYLPGQVCALLSTPATDHPASCASPPTSASDSSSQSEKLKSHITGWNRLTVAFLLGAMFLIFTVKPRVDAAAKAEDRAATAEHKAYDAALDERNKAHDAAYRAKEDVKRAVDGILPALVPPPPGGLDPRVAKLSIIQYNAVIAREKADKKAEEKCPLVGLARMGRFERWTVRIFFALSILYSFGAGICSAAAYFRSAELELGDSMSLGAVIGSIVVPGVPFVLAHFHLLYVAFREN
ncbi:hypothetical protein ACQJBY_019195 [Aegilops geniculata]